MINALDAEIKITLDIIDLNCEYTLKQIDIPYLNKTVEVKIPHNIQPGYRIRLNGLGYEDERGIRGDFYVTVEKIRLLNESEKINMQQMIVVKNNDFYKVNEYLRDGWKVKEFKPFKDSMNVYVYVLIEK